MLKINCRQLPKNGINRFLFKLGIVIIILSMLPALLMAAADRSVTAAGAADSQLKHQKESVKTPMKKIRILLRDFRKVVKDGQVVNFNIGTTAHGPGAITVLEKFVPECEVIVWATAPLSEPMQRMMQRRFPEVKIVYGRLDEGTPAVEAAARWCDLLLIGPGTGIAVHRDVEAFTRFCDKPYAAAGIGFAAKDVAKMRRSDFIFLRDTVALAAAEKAELGVPTAFVPDGAFLFDAADDTGAAEFMRRHGLENGKFVCCLPRYRYTPTWEFCPGETYPEDRIAYNKSMVRQDMEPLVKAACRVVREKGWKVLLSPETEPAIRLCKNELLSMFPADVKPFIVVPDHFWEADLALGVYKQSRGLFGIEMHSQVMAVGNGIPAMVCRTKEFGSKSQMWVDIGLKDWLFDFDLPGDRERFPEAVMQMLNNEEDSAKQIKHAQSILQERFEFFGNFMREHYGK
ncbi:MAG: polysaccharide pyruvyl transferase family protein [Lentisphaerae bacterium]|nr:polysaccharide pyruvyl transferase family protein [Lentisphaerota bacterium]